MEGGRLEVGGWTYDLPMLVLWEGRGEAVFCRGIPRMAQTGVRCMFGGINRVGRVQDKVKMAQEFCSLCRLGWMEVVGTEAVLCEAPEERQHHSDDNDMADRLHLTYSTASSAPPSYAAATNREHSTV